MRGIVKIKNVSGTDYVLEELAGLVLVDQEEVDLLNPEIPDAYDEYQVALVLVTALTTAQLYQDIQAGKITLLETTPPLGV